MTHPPTHGAVPMPFPVVALRGDARARGHAYGETLRDRVHAAWHAYEAFIFAPKGLGEPTLRRMADAARSRIAGFCADACAEIEALAEATGIASWRLFALNARTEIVNALDAGHVPMECTAFHDRAGGVLAQNWDWTQFGMDLGAFLDVVGEDGRSQLVFTEAGMLGKIGLNSDGFGVCINILRAAHAQIGVPVAVLARALLQARDVSEALAIFDRAGADRATHFLVADAQGHGRGIEYAGTLRRDLLPEHGRIVHTNHCIAPELAALEPALSGSPERLHRARVLCDAADVVDVAAAQRILGDRAAQDGASLNVAWRDSSMLPGQRVGTCASVVMDLRARRLHARRGPDVEGPWASWTVGVDAAA